MYRVILFVLDIAQEEPEPSQASQYMGMSRSQMPEQMQSMIPESQQALFAPQQVQFFTFSPFLYISLYFYCSYSKQFSNRY